MRPGIHRLSLLWVAALVLLAGYAGAPPVTHLARLLGWEPLPLTVREARRLAAAGWEHFKGNL